MEYIDTSNLSILWILATIFISTLGFGIIGVIVAAFSDGKNDAEIVSHWATCGFIIGCLIQIFMRGG